MKKIYCIGLLIVSCASVKDVTVLKFTGYDNVDKANYIYKLNVPNGFKMTEVSGGGEWKEKRCEYSDGSTLYINNERNLPTINYKNIESDNTSMQKSLTSSNDTLTVWGKDKNGNYWKNKKLKYINVGYLNIPPNKKEIFDKALSSVGRK